MPTQIKYSGATPVFKVNLEKIHILKNSNKTLIMNKLNLKMTWITDTIEFLPLMVINF